MTSCRLRQKCQKTVSTKKKKCLKRKAVSPLQVSDVNAAILSTDQACTGVVDNQAGSVDTNNQNTPRKPVRQSSPEHFNPYIGYTSADLQHLVYNMNVPQSPFGGYMQPVQSPPYGSQFQTASATPSNVLKYQYQKLTILKKW